MKFKSKEEAIKYHIDNYHTDHIKKVEWTPENRGFNRINFILESIPEGSYVLDVGTNGGGNALLLQDKKNCYVKGIDIMQDLVDVANKRGVFAEIGSAEDLTRFKDNTFDVVLCSEVLEHLFDPMPAINEAYRVLIPGGIYVVTFPHPNGIGGGTGDFHQTTYNDKDIVKMFDKFIDVDVYGIPVSEIFAAKYNMSTTDFQWWGIIAKKKEEESDVQ